MIQRRESIFVKLICRSRATAVQEQRLLVEVVFYFWGGDWFVGFLSDKHGSNIPQIKFM